MSVMQSWEQCEKLLTMCHAIESIYFKRLHLLREKTK